MPTIFQQLPNGILSRALTFLPTRDLLELMLVSWKHYQIAVPSAYRSLSINGVYELERLLDMLYSTETAICEYSFPLVSAESAGVNSMSLTYLQSFR